MRRTTRGSNTCNGNHVKVTEVRFVSAAAADVEHGLLYWASCVLNNAVSIDGITVRRKLSGERAVAFPTRKDSCGRKHSILRPLNNRVRRELEAQILLALDLEENARG